MKSHLKKRRKIEYLGVFKCLGEITNVFYIGYVALKGYLSNNHFFVALRVML